MIPLYTIGTVRSVRTVGSVGSVGTHEFLRGSASSYGWVHGRRNDSPFRIRIITDCSYGSYGSYSTVEAFR